MTTLPGRRVELYDLGSSSSQREVLPGARRFLLLCYVVCHRSFEPDYGHGHVDCHAYLRMIELSLTMIACFQPTP